MLKHASTGVEANDRVRLQHAPPASAHRTPTNSRMYRRVLHVNSSIRDTSSAEREGNYLPLHKCDMPHSGTHKQKKTKKKLTLSSLVCLDVVHSFFSLTGKNISRLDSLVYFGVKHQCNLLVVLIYYLIARFMTYYVPLNPFIRVYSISPPTPPIPNLHPYATEKQHLGPSPEFLPQRENARHLRANTHTRPRRKHQIDNLILLHHHRERGGRGREDKANTHFTYAPLLFSLYSCTSCSSLPNNHFLLDAQKTPFSRLRPSHTSDDLQIKGEKKTRLGGVKTHTIDRDGRKQQTALNTPVTPTKENALWRKPFPTQPKQK